MDPSTSQQQRQPSPPRPPPPTPTTHVLRPHHIGILSILILLKENEGRPLSAPFMLHVYRILLYEISEVAEPKPWHRLLREIASGPPPDMADDYYIIEQLKEVHTSLRNSDDLTTFFNGVTLLFMGEDEAFVRSLVSSAQEATLAALHSDTSARDYQAWRNGDIKAGYDDMPMDRLNNDVLSLRTQQDLKQYATPESYAAFEKATAVADVSEAVESVRRYFEQHFNDENESGYRQHTLINLIRYYYTRREFAAAKDLMDEAIDMARRNGDKLADEYLQSLSSRLPNKESGRRPTLNTIRPLLHPYEVLFDVKKLMQVEYEQPLSASFEKIVESIAIFDQWVEKEESSYSEAEQWGQHAVQSLLWNAAGCNRLCEIEENIVLAFTEVAGDDNNRVTVLLNKAYREARQGRYEQALSMLLEPDTWRGLAMSDYELWANEIWHILVLRATRRGQIRLYKEYLRPKRPMGVYKSRDYFLEMQASPSSKIRDPLHEVIYASASGNGTGCVEPLLTSLWNSEFQCRYGSYRTGITLLADVGMEFGMTKRSEKILQEIMPQIISGDDLELRALACFTMARCTIAAGDADNPGHEEALEYLKIAEKDYAILEIFTSLAKVQYLMAILYDTLGHEESRNAAARRYHETQQRLTQEGADSIDPEVIDVWSLVADVGAALSMR